MGIIRTGFNGTNLGAINLAIKIKQCQDGGGVWNKATQACETLEVAQARALPAWTSRIPQYREVLNNEVLRHMDNVAADTVPTIQKFISDHLTWWTDTYARPAGRADEAAAIWNEQTFPLRRALDFVREGTQHAVGTDPMDATHAPQICNLLRGWDWQGGQCVNRAEVAAAQAADAAAAADAALQAELLKQAGGGFDVKKLLIPGIAIVGLLAVLKMRKKR